MTQNGNIILETRGVSCSKVDGAEPLSPVIGVSLSVHEKTLNLLTGGGQDGGNLLLRLLGLLETPDVGAVYFHGQATGRLADEARADLRSQHYGFLFAQPFLLPSFSVIENVAMPLFKISGVSAAEAQRRTEAMLEFVGIGNHAETAVGQLSFPEQQRVSLARALVNQPDILIVENVDAELSGGALFDFMEIIRRAASAFGTAAILTTKDRELAKFADRVVELACGAVFRDSQTAVKEGGAAV